jgi:hypothetical protein
MPRRTKPPSQNWKAFLDNHVADLVSIYVFTVRTGTGSRVVFELRGKRTYLHRPHPEREAEKYQVEEVREFLRSLEITP